MKLSAYIILFYALLIFFGGMMGYAKAHSLSSLIAGTLCAFLLSIAAIGMIKKSLLAYFVALGSVSSLILFFTYRFFLTNKFMPAGLMVLLSVAALSALLFFTKQRKEIKL